ncbi:hypothetical protein [Fibrella arboris]|uniref:hypothetical protein n=1 Tax=Fibrella arboris TaxID=3242486 RepID=UPI0035222F7E
MAAKQAETLITSTIETLDNGVDRVEPKDGASLIKDWITVVKQDESTSDLANDLQVLHDQLSDKEPDRKKIAQLVKKLGNETAQAAKKAERDLQDYLKDLGESLKDFANELK